MQILGTPNGLLGVKEGKFCPNKFSRYENDGTIMVGNNASHGFIFVFSFGFWAIPCDDVK